MHNTNAGLHVCIIGAGSAGWLAYHKLKFHPRVTKITMISSPTIPKIGVGESTTLSFEKWLHQDMKLSITEIKKFLIDIDASIKYGVSYEGWSPNKFLHHFNNSEGGAAITLSKKYSLGVRPESINHNDAAVPLHSYIYNNNVYADSTLTWLDLSLQGHSYHFDASKFIQALHELAKNDSKLHFIYDDVVDSHYQGDAVQDVVLKTGNTVNADYFISCIGQTSFNQKIFHEEYISYSDYLLTNKALFAPIEYTDSVSQFHPYTIAKTMRHGWRWITPTRSRIGTGYVFSENHVSIDEAIDELRKDTGIPNLDPFVVDFYPRKVKKTFKPNMCTLGMASGFLEPLDAPGLTLISYSLDIIEKYLNHPHINIDILNKKVNYEFDYWCSFILHQYKTCHRTDTNFWNDHKSVSFNFYDDRIKEYFNPYYSISNLPGTQVRSLRLNPEIKNFDFYNNSFMFYHTSSGKDIKWPKESRSAGIPYIPHNLFPRIDKTRILTHREYFDKMLSEVMNEYTNSHK